MTQQIALKALKQGYNIFLTGAAGSGKTFVLNQYIGYLKKKGIAVAVTASTGIAATHMNGITIHAWSGMGIRSNLTEADFKTIGRNARVRKRLKSARVLIIDEVSMLHAYQLDMVDAICRRFLDKHLPFGGLQVILCGDFFQLPPISRDYSVGTSYIFSGFAYRAGQFKVCYLNEQHRQKGGVLADILNSVRSGQVNSEHVGQLRQRIGANLDESFIPTRLFSHNQEVDVVNNVEFRKLPGEIRRYDMRSTGPEQLVETLKAGCLAPECLHLKIGSVVMFVKNNFTEGYVNGTTGVVEGFDYETKMPIVRTPRGQLFTAVPETWLVGDEESVLASVRQVPLRLAWAITIHKSQGMSLDAAEIDLAKAFEFGMGYVALSRVRTLEGLRLLGLNEIALTVNPEIQIFDQELSKASTEFEEEINKLEVKEKAKPKAKALKLVSQTKKDYTITAKSQKYAKANQPWNLLEDMLITEMFQQGLNTQFMTLQFQRSRQEIAAHLKKLGLVKK